LEVAKRLYDKIAAERGTGRNSITGSLRIGIVSGAIQYSYHYVAYKDREKERSAIIGFYYSGKYGYDSPAFRVEDNENMTEFDKNFDRMSTDGMMTHPLLICSRGDLLLSEKFDEIKRKLGTKIK
jgi:hypothetical protein